MLSLYLLCGIVGLGWTIANFVLGQITGGEIPEGGELSVGGSFGEGGEGHAVAQDHGSLQLPLFSPTAIAGYLTGFGCTGYGLVDGLGIVDPLIHVPISVVGAGLVGLLVAWGTAVLLQAGETDSTLRRQSLVGRQGELSVGIPAGGAGEVTYLAGGVRSSAPARSADGAAIPRGTLVRIVRVDDVTLVVEPAEERTAWRV